MNNKNLIYLFGLLLFVFILGTNLYQIEGLTTIEKIRQKHESNTSINKPNEDLKMEQKQSYDNYNHYENTAFPTIFYGDNESKVILDTKTKTLYLIDISGNTTVYNSNINSVAKHLTEISFYSEDGSVAKIYSVNNVFIKITDPNGNKKIYKVNYKPKIVIDKDIHNSPTTYYGSTGSHIPPPMPISNNKSDLYILKSQIVPPLCPAKQEAPIILNDQPPSKYNEHPVTHKEYTSKPANYPAQNEPPVLKKQNYSNEQSCNLLKTQSQYKPHLTSYATSQISGTHFNKFKNINSINSEFLPIPVLNSFHSFGK